MKTGQCQISRSVQGGGGGEVQKGEKLYVVKKEGVGLIQEELKKFCILSLLAHQATTYLQFP